MSSRRFEVLVASQNILLDKGRTSRGQILPQDERIEAMSESLSASGTSFDIIGIQEAYESQKQHNGKLLATNLGYEQSYWLPHNQPSKAAPGKGRKGEYIGMFGTMVDYAEPIELGDRRRAVMTTIADVAFVTLHLRAGGGEARRLRYLQASELVEILEDYPDAVVLGDFNEPPIPFYSAARKVLRNAGFVSAFEAKPNSVSPPHTYPVPAYRSIASSSHGWQGAIMRHEWPIDDILIRGDIDAYDAGVIEPKTFGHDQILDPTFNTAPRVPSDHRGVWARLGIAATGSSDIQPYTL